MKYWTIQKKSVLNKIEKEGVYYPEFSKSDYIKENKNLAEIFNLVLGSFNSINHSNQSGLIFAFLYSDNKDIFHFNSIDSFKILIQSKKDVVVYFWNKFKNDDSVILELEYQESFNPIFIDVNDFQFLMPPVDLHPLLPYTNLDIDKLYESINKGVFISSKYPSYLIQAHLPYIKKENIVGIHSMFSLN